MNCPLDRTTALGVPADSVGSGYPASPNRAGRVGFVGRRNCRLTEIIPTA